MRKAVVLFLAVTVLCSVALPGYAAGNTGGIEEIVTADVYAGYIRAADPNVASVENGNASVTTESGYTVSVTGAPADAVYLRVIPIPAYEQEAWNWFRACLGDAANPLAVFDIYFEDADGNRINANGVSVSITYNSETEKVYSVATNGSAVALDAAISEGTVAFTANGSHYYVLAKTVAASAEPEKEVISSKPEGGSVEISDDHPKAGDTVSVFNNPQTGDGNDPLLWIGMMLASLIAVFWIVMSMRKRSKNES